MRIEHVGPLSVARIMGVVNFMGGILVGIGLMVLSLMGDTRFDINALLVIPLLYGVLGFLGGFLGAFFFNWAVRMFGGLEVRLSAPADGQS